LPDDFSIEVLAAAERLRVQTRCEMERLHRLSGGDYGVSSELQLFGQSADRNGVELVAPHLGDIEAIVARYRSALPSGNRFAPPPPPVAPMESAPLVSGPGSTRPRPRSLLNGSLRPPSALPGVLTDYEDTYGDDVGEWPSVDGEVPPVGVVEDPEVGR
jgi:hypothetical protein